MSCSISLSKIIKELSEFAFDAVASELSRRTAFEKSVLLEFIRRADRLGLSLSDAVLGIIAASSGSCSLGEFLALVETTQEDVPKSPRHDAIKTRLTRRLGRD